MKRTILALILTLAFVLPVFAQQQLTLATGSQKATYAKMCKNIAQFCPVIKEYTETTGGFDNLDLLLTNKINMGMVPEDVMEMARRTDPKISKKIKGLVGLHFNSLHIVIMKNGGKSGKKAGWWSKLTGGGSEEQVTIRDLRDLRGHKVACYGSSIVTGEFLNERLKAGLVLVRVKSPGEGEAMLKSGEAVALFGTAGWPLGWVENMDPNLFTLASLSESDIKTLGAPYQLVKLNYPQLNAMGVITAGSRNIIAVRNYKSKSKIKMLREFKQCLLDNLLEIKEMDGGHPSWNNVDDPEDFTWPKYGPAEDIKAKDGEDSAPAEKPAPMEKEE